MNVCRKEPPKINCTLRIKIYALLTIFPDQPLPNAVPVNDTEENGYNPRNLQKEFEVSKITEFASPSLYKVQVTENQSNIRVFDG